MHSAPNPQKRRALSERVTERRIIPYQPQHPAPRQAHRRRGTPRHVAFVIVQFVFLFLWCTWRYLHRAGQLLVAAISYAVPVFSSLWSLLAWLGTILLWLGTALWWFFRVTVVIFGTAVIFFIIVRYYAAGRPAERPECRPGAGPAAAQGNLGSFTAVFDPISIIDAISKLIYGF
jgi:hypothetical protein